MDKQPILVLARERQERPIPISRGDDLDANRHGIFVHPTRQRDRRQAEGIGKRREHGVAAGTDGLAVDG
jgi:hypothetical protein